MSTIVFDLECAKHILSPDHAATDEGQDLLANERAVVGWSNAHLAGIGSATAYHVERDRYYLFSDTRREHELLAELIIDAEHVVGFNHILFDYPLLAHSLDIAITELTDVDAQPGARDIDLLQMMWGGLCKSPTHGYSLDAIARKTLGEQYEKTGSGKDAPDLYQQGRWAELFSYNLRDVQVTHQLHAFMQLYGWAVNGKGAQVQVRHPNGWFRGGFTKWLDDPAT